MLDANIKTQLQSHFEKLSHPIELVATLDYSEKSRELRELLDELASLSPKITVRHDGSNARKPAFAITRPGSDIAVTFAGIPMGHEFTSLVIALLQVGGHPPKLSDDVIEQIRSLDGNYHFETYFSLSCQNCPDVVQALNLMSILNPRIRHEAIDGGLFPNEVEQRQVMAVPSVFLNDAEFDQGRMTVEQILRKLDSGASQREAATLNEREPYDVLIVGGGPAGAAAAIYAARKGIRTGIVAERFGGQVMDTLGIENFISVEYTEGPKLVAAMESHVRSYGVDVIEQQTASGLKPGELAEVQLSNGASLRGKTVVLAPGARWKELNVPGEQEYRNKGVAYCPHCDGPLFKGKHVAVIGGGNSGVEAAIDLAGLVGHVTLLEFAAELKADAVLQNKLRSLKNVDIIVNAQTTEVTGDGKKVNGLVYHDRASQTTHRVELEGVFVQIGLVPNTQWLHDAVRLSRYGEIEVDNRAETSVPGIFAAGDATTVPYKQIVVAMGEGTKAALSAFDYLIRHSVEASTEAPAAAATA